MKQRNKNGMEQHGSVKDWLKSIYERVSKVSIKPAHIAIALFFFMFMGFAASTIISNTGVTGVVDVNSTNVHATGAITGATLDIQGESDFTYGGIKLQLNSAGSAFNIMTNESTHGDIKISALNDTNHVGINVGQGNAVSTFSFSRDDNKNGRLGITGKGRAENTDPTEYSRLTMSSLGLNISTAKGDIFFEPYGDMTANSKLTINQDADDIGLSIDSEATTATSYGISVDMGSNGGYASKFSFSGTANDFVSLAREPGATGSSYFYRSLNSTYTDGPIVYVLQDDAVDDQNAMSIRNDGVGSVLYLNALGNFNTNNAALQISIAGTNNANGYGVYVVDTGTYNADTIGAEFTKDSAKQIVRLNNVLSSSTASNYFYRNENSTNTAGPLMLVKQDEALDDQDALDVVQDAAAKGISIDQNGDGAAIYIDSEASTDPAIKITTSSGGCGSGDYGLYTNSTGHLLYCLNGVEKVVTLS